MKSPALPLLLVAGLLLLALPIELLRYHTLLWPPKLPLAACLLFAFFRCRRCTSSSS